ncbi:MAG: type II secretion system protein GspG [bacterium]|nr:type II secretion system protein GspG [bacterium]
MTLKKIFGWLVFLGILCGVVYFFWEPGKLIISNLIREYTPAPTRPPEQAAAGFGIAIDQAADGLTGATQVGALQRAKTKISDAELAVIRNAVFEFQSRFNRMPNNLDELQQTGSLSGSSGLNDPWGTKYQSKLVNNKFYIITAGPDKAFGTSDDQEIEINR